MNKNEGGRLTGIAPPSILPSAPRPRPRAKALFPFVQMLINVMCVLTLRLASDSKDG